MSSVKSRTIAGVCLLFFSLAGSDAHGEQVAREQLPATLEYIARGYETNIQSLGPIRIQGRTFHSQWAREGAQIPSNETIPPVWLDFEYMEREGKRRYEQHNPSVASEYHYALDNNKRLLTFAPSIVDVYPLTDEEDRWPRLMHRYGRFQQVHPAGGYESVSRTMRTLLKDIQTGKFDAKNWEVSVDVAPEGLFAIRLKRNIVTEEYVIDSRKGFNLVKADYSEPSKKLWREIHGDYEYKQLENGSWILSAATIKGRSGDVLYERRLESAKIEAGFMAPDEMFEEGSLSIPPNTYRVDHSFSPPLELYKGSGPGIDTVENLMDTTIAQAEIAEVSGDGNVAVAAHDAYIAHSQQDVSSRGTVGHRPFVMVAILAVVVALLGALVYMKLSHRRRLT